MIISSAAPLQDETWTHLCSHKPPPRVLVYDHVTKTVQVSPACCRAPLWQALPYQNHAHCIRLVVSRYSDQCWPTSTLVAWCSSCYKFAGWPTLVAKRLAFGVCLALKSMLWTTALIFERHQSPPYFEFHLVFCFTIQQNSFFSQMISISKPDLLLVN